MNQQFRLRTVVAACCLSVVSLSACAGGTSDATPAKLPATLQALVDKGRAEVMQQFATDVPGLTGYVVTHGGTAEIIYGIDDHLIVGQLISAQGEDLTASYGNRYLPKPDYAAAVKKLDAAGHLVSEGAAQAPVLYAIVDPDCIFCRHLYVATRAPVAAGTLHMEWVIVGFLKSSSAGRAAAILEAPDPLAALKKNYENFDAPHEEGGAPPAKPDSATLGLLKTHLKIMHDVEGSGTPTLLYKGPDGKWAAHVGFPSPAWLKAYQAGKPVAG